MEKQRVVFAVDNRLRVPLADLPEGIAESLRAECRHKNPAFHKAKAMGFFPKKGEKAMIETWREKNGILSLPRGTTQGVRAVFERAGLPEPEWDDQRCSGTAFQKGFEGDPLLTLWDHQESVVEAALTRENCLIRAPTGCLAGETLIGVSRGGKGQQIKLSHLVKMFNGGKASNRVWDLTIPTMVRAQLDDKSIGLVQLVGAYESGVKPVFKLILDGRFIRATADHRFKTLAGWKRLGELVVGDLVFVEDSRRPKVKGAHPRQNYLQRKAKLHPFAGRKGVKPGKGGFTVPFHRLVWEANLNGLGLEEFLRRVNEGPIDGLEFVDPSTHAVHHKDRNPKNNELSNLQLLTCKEHKQAHRKEYLENLSCRSTLQTVRAILPDGEAPTYDLEMAGPHNFVANGIVVHNSGKTTAAIALVARCKLPTLIVVWSSSLFDQWVERLCKELGLKKSQIGQIRGSKRTIAPITMAMQQTLYANPKLVRELKPKFGCVMADEVQRFAARTFMDVIDVFPARYRIGWSADERRKDQKHFLIYDVFGSVAADIKREDLVEKKLVHDVEICVVPTQFTADWYVRQLRSDNETPDFNGLLDSMVNNEERNWLISHYARVEQAFGNQVLALTHRREHALALARREVEAGFLCGTLLGGKDNSKEFETTINSMRSRNLHFAAGTYQAIGQGMDIPTVQRGIACTPIATNEQFFGQVRGRLCRTTKGKQDAALIYLWDQHVFGIEHLLNLKRWNKNVRVLADNGAWVSVDDWLDEWRRESK